MPSKLIEIGNQVLILAGVQPETWQHDFSVVASWLQAGADPEQDIYPTVKRLVADNPNFTPPRSAGALRYFSRAIEEARSNRLAGGNGPLPSEDPDWWRWDARCSGWFKRAFWIVEWGPKPGEPRCQAPPELVEKYGGAAK